LQRGKLDYLRCETDPKFRRLETTVSIIPMEYLTVLKKEINTNIIGVREKGTKGRRKKSVKRRTKEQVQKIKGGKKKQ
jgi:hypothetical protein